MKKLFVLAVVLLFAAGTVYAEGETVSFSGEYRVEMYQKSNQGFNDDDANQLQYVDQRFRLQTTFTPAEGVMAILRGDYAEEQWGDIGYRPPAGSSTIMIDKAYVDVTKAMFNIKAGLWGDGGVGKNIVTSDQGTQFKVTGSFEPVSVVGTYRKNSEGTALSDDGLEGANEGLDKDNTVMSIDVGYAGDGFGVGAFYATKNSPNAVDATEDDVQNVMGVYGDYAMGKMSFWAELDMLSGDDGADTDYVGTQFAVNASMAVNEKLNASLDVWYAQGTDEDNEVQITSLDNDWWYIPQYGGEGGLTYEVMEYIDPHMVEANAGATGIAVTAHYLVLEDLTLNGCFAYVTAQTEDPDDDDAYVSDYNVISVSGDYTFAPNTVFTLAYETLSRNGELGDDDAAVSNLGAQLKVKF